MLYLFEFLIMVCSICLKNENIFDVNVDNGTNGSDEAILRKLRICVPEVVWDVSFKLCLQCEKDLENIYSFKELCINSYTTWKKSKDTGDDENIFDDVSYSEQKEELENKTRNSKKQTGNDHGTKVPCQNCGKLYTTKDILKKHCNVCVKKNGVNVGNEIKTVISKEILDVDEESVQIDDELKINNFSTCTLCGAILTNKYLLRRHVQNVHATEKKFRCEICERAFTSAVYLSAHKRYHTGDRSHICSSCGKGFITASDLYHHEKIHANKRAYRCETCPKAFNTSSDLHKHKICVHLDRSLWKYTCTICDRKFPLKINLDSHLKAHRGEKNHSCHLCDKKCITKSVLRNHIQTHTNIMTLACGLCSHTYKYKKSLNHHMAKAHSIGNVKILHTKKPDEKNEGLLQQP